MSTWTRYSELVARGPSVERASFFSDAVIAIALTLLIIELHAPAVPEDELGRALLELLPEYGTFVLSFVVIGIVWLFHHRMFRLIQAHTQTLLRLNLLMLLLVATLPLPTAVLGRYQNSSLAVVLYAALIIAIGGMLALVWAYAWRQGLVERWVGRDLWVFILGQSLVIPAVFALSIPVALLFGADPGKFTWIVALPAYVVLGRVVGSRLREDQPENARAALDAQNGAR